MFLPGDETYERVRKNVSLQLEIINWNQASPKVAGIPLAENEDIS